MKKKTIISSLLALTFLSLASCTPSSETPTSSVPAGSDPGSSLAGSSVDSSEASSSAEQLTVSILTPEKTALDVGEELRLHAKVEGGSVEGYNVNWYSSNPAVISITQSGKVIALAPGESQIQAKVGDFVSEPLLLTVQEAKHPSVSLKAPTTSVLGIGQTLQLEAVTVDAEGLALSFVADNDNVTVSSEGLVTGVKVGTSRIKAKLGEDLFSNEIELTVVEEVEALSVTLAPVANPILVKGKTLTLSAEVKGNYSAAPVVFASSAEDVASVSQEGVVTALKSGEATISVSVLDVKDEVNIQVIDDYDAVESISYPVSELTIAKGESYVFEGVTILPKTADQSYEIESSDPLKVSVDGNEITARAIASDPITVTLKAGDKSFPIAVTVKTSKEVHTAEVLEKLQKANEKELTLAKSGHFYVQDKDNSGADTTYDKFDFDVYSDSKNQAIHETKTKYTTSTDRITWTRVGDGLVKATQTLKDGQVSSSYYANYGIVADDATPSSSQIKQSDAEKGLNLPVVDSGNSPSRFGFAGGVISRYFSSGHTYFSESSLAENVASFTYSKEGDVYTLGIDSMATSSSTDKDHLELVLTFEGDLLKAVSGTIKHFKGDIDYDTDETTWTENGSSTIDGTLETGEREASPEGSFDADSCLASSFDAQFYNGYGSSKKVSTKFGINENFSMELVNILPEAYSSSLDPASVAFPGHEDIVKRGTWGYSFTVTQAIADLEVVVSTAKVSKTYHLTIEELHTSDLSFSGSAVGLKGEKLTGQVNFTKNSSIDLSYEVIGDNADKASVTSKLVNASMGYGKFEFTASEAGTYTVKVADSKSGLSKTEEIIVKDDTDEGIAEFIAGNTWGISGYGNSLSSLKQQEDGSFIAVIKLSCMDDYYDDVTVNVTLTFKVSGGAIVLVSSSADDSDSEIVCKSIQFGSSHSTITAKFSGNSEWDIPSSASLTVK